jgi:hypothetical protein
MLRACTASCNMTWLLTLVSATAAADGVIPGTGHFHVLIDLPSAPEGETIPFDDVRKHYGKGQLSADIALSPVSDAID